VLRVKLTFKPKEGPPDLLPNIETPNEIEVTLRIHLLEIIQQPPTTTHQHEQTPPARKIFLVPSQVLGQRINP